jgi:hypothetical protein
MSELSRLEELRAKHRPQPIQPVEYKLPIKQQLRSSIIWWLEHPDNVWYGSACGCLGPEKDHSYCYCRLNSIAFRIAERYRRRHGLQRKPARLFK